MQRRPIKLPRSASLLYTECLWLLIHIDVQCTDHSASLRVAQPVFHQSHQHRRDRVFRRPDRQSVHLFPVSSSGNHALHK